MKQHVPEEAPRLIAAAATGRPETESLLLRTLLFAGLTALCARIAFPLPFTPVPVTLQVAAVVFAGLALPPKVALASQGVYLASGLLGAPVFAYGARGFHYLANPMGTGGYLLSYPLAALLVSLLARHARERALSSDIRAAFAGVALIYLLGCIWLGTWLELSPSAAFLQGAGWFLVWDTAKVLAAVLAARALRAKR